MNIKSILAGAAIALATTAGAATAGIEAGTLDGTASLVPFSVLTGVSAIPMGEREMSETRGAFQLLAPRRHMVLDNAPELFPVTGTPCVIIRKGSGPESC